MNRFILAIVLMAMLVSACTISAPEPAPKPILALAIPATNTLFPSATATAAPAATFTPIPAKPTKTAVSTPFAYGPDKFPATINPLTGQPVSDTNALNRRPMAVKVQLYPRGQRPVYGISLADIVYDYYQNDGLTRLNALFYGSDAKQIGPVRSARLFDENIIRMYKSIFAFGGAADYVLKRFYNADYADRLVTESHKNCPPMCRVDPNGYNFLFTNSSELALSALKNGVKNDRQNLDGMSFNSQAPVGGQPGRQLINRYSISSYNRWDYDPASGRYLRFQDTQEDENKQGEAFAPMIDGLTNAPIAADNVVVLFLTHQPANIIGDKDALDIRLSGSGDAYAFRDGQAYKVRWNRPTMDSVLFLTFEDGKPFPFKPGNTWFQVVGQTSSIVNPESGLWRFNSQNP
jgi:hypothetical protein